MQRIADEEKLVESKAFVLMPDHLHWLFALTEKVVLASVMRLVKGCSAKQINAYLKRKGPEWDKAFHGHALRKDEDIINIARYIVANPLRAGLVKNIAQYPLWDAIWLEE